MIINETPFRRWFIRVGDSWLKRVDGWPTVDRSAVLTDDLNKARIYKRKCDAVNSLNIWRDQIIEASGSGYEPKVIMIEFEVVTMGVYI